MNLSAKITFLILSTVVFAFSVQAQGSLSALDLEALKNIEERYRTAWLKSDEKTILSLFTDDAALYPNGGKPVKGKDEMAKYWFAPSETVTVIQNFEVKIEDIVGDKDFAAVTGTNEIEWISEKKNRAETKRFAARGYFISVYVRRNREWKIYKQFWNGKTEEIKAGEKK